MLTAAILWPLLALPAALLIGAIASRNAPSDEFWIVAERMGR